ncbi:MAG: SDR family oxidoreductase, partial [Rhizobiales bacterium]|nr:SDR family oxidoreductase [Hyphomicrobiales bacterium]
MRSQARREGRRVVERKAILVTGGSRGIGRSTALKAGALGWSVAVNYHLAAEAAESVAAEIGRTGGCAVTVEGDVSSESDIERIFGTAEEAIGPLDGVVVNAGIVAPASSIIDMTYDRVRRMFDTNVMGTFLTAREAARSFARNNRPGSMVIVSSAASRLGSPGEYVDYAASKGAADALTIGLSKELGPLGVRVNAIRPAFIETEIHASGSRPDRARELGATTPLGRAGSPEEVADAIVWLLSDSASYVTGSFIEMSGDVRTTIRRPCGLARPRAGIPSASQRQRGAKCLMFGKPFRRSRSEGRDRRRGWKIREVVDRIHAERSSAGVTDRPPCRRHLTGHEAKAVSAAGPGAIGHKTPKVVADEHLLERGMLQERPGEEGVEQARCRGCRPDQATMEDPA